MIKKLKSKKGYIFTYEALAVAFIFVSIIYIANMAYVHNSQTFLDIKKDIDVAHKSILLKDYYIKKYSFPGKLYNSTNFKDLLANNIKNKNIKTFDLCNNFTNETGKLYFLVYPSNSDELLYNKISTKINNGNFSFSLSNNVETNLSIYSNMVNLSNSAKIINNSLAGDIGENYKIFDDVVYIPIITFGGDGYNNVNYNCYGSNGDIIYFYIGENNPNVNINLNIRSLENNENNLGIYNNDWRYYSELKIINNLNINLNNYAVKYTFNSQQLINDNEMNNDCSDIRIIDNNGNELNYWIEPNTINTTNTIIWIKTNLTPNEQKQIYMLYGNNLANSVSNGENTFLFFDNFTNGVNNNKWVIDPNTNIINNNDNYTTNGINYTYISLNNGLIRTINSYPVNTSVRSKMKYSNNINEYFGYENYENIFVEHSDRIGNNNFLYILSNGSNMDYTLLPDLSNNWNTYEIQRNNNKNTNLIINNNIEEYQKFNIIPTNNMYITYKTNNNGQINVDWVFVRNYVNNEPTVMGKHNLIFELNGKVYSINISNDGGGNFENINNQIKNGINEIKILNSDTIAEFNIGNGPESDFQTVTLSPRNIKMVVIE